MGKISITEVAKVLIEKKGLSAKDAELFVLTMFDIVQEGLRRDKIVKIKGLGTFKIIEVDARESINVNTGERVVIDSHGKITFTPDTAMKELVNKPFSQFETVILNEGVEFDDIREQSDDMKSDNQDADSDSQLISNENILSEPNESIDTPPSVVPAEVEKREEFIDRYISTIGAQAEFPNIKDEPIEAKPVNDEPHTQIAEEENVEETLPEYESDDAIDSSDEIDFEDENEGSSKTKWIIFSVISLVLILCSAYGGYLYGVKVTKEELQTITIPSVHDQLTPALEIHPDSISVADDTLKTIVQQPNSNDTTSTDSSTVVKEEKSYDSTTEAKKEETPAFDSEKYELMDSRVRTGAYRIVGTDYTVVIRNGETMKRLCKRTLGEGMACYIEVYNDMEPNGKLIAGKRIKIPKLEWKKKRKK